MVQCKQASLWHKEEKLCPPLATTGMGGLLMAFLFGGSSDLDPTSEPEVEIHPSRPFSNISWASSRALVVSETWNICLSGYKPPAHYPRLKCARKLLACPSLRMNFFNLSLHLFLSFFFFFGVKRFRLLWNYADSRWYTLIYFFKMVHF